jgi:hypothetical protein
LDEAANFVAGVGLGDPGFAAVAALDLAAVFFAGPCFEVEVLGADFARVDLGLVGI